MKKAPGFCAQQRVSKLVTFCFFIQVRLIKTHFALENADRFNANLPIKIMLMGVPTLEQFVPSIELKVSTDNPS
jgi:hypothetical protein